MYTIKEQDSWFYLEQDGRQLTTPGGKPVRTMFKELADRLVVDLEKYGEDPGDPVSLVAFHYAMIEFFLNTPREQSEAQYLIGFDPKWDWTMTCPSGNPEMMMAWMGLFGLGVQMEEAKRWVNTLTEMQLCAATVIGAYFESVSIPYLMATVLNDFDAKKLKKYVKAISKYYPIGSVEDATKALENFKFYFNVDKGK